MPIASTALPTRRACRPSRRARSPARCSKASTSTTRCSASARARRGATSRPATGSRSSTSPATGSTSTTGACSETAERIAREFRTAGLDGAGSDALWEQVKLHYIGLLIDHRQPECAETFFNSVSVKILHRAYFHNRFIFVRPAISTEHIDAEPPSYTATTRCSRACAHALIDIVLDLGFERRFADFRRDLRHVLAAFRRRFPRPFALEANHQIQVLSSPFFRNQTAYVVGRVVNGIDTYPFVVPVKHDAAGRLYLDALLMDDADLAILFSANRAYFLVDMEVPSAYVGFLRAMLPDKTASELYTMVGLQKAGKNLFYRDFLHHLKHSRDKFIIAPGHQGPGDDACSRCRRIPTCSR